MDVRLVSPSVWWPRVDWIGQSPLDSARGRPVASTRSAQIARLADAVLWTLQDAHVGITPALAYELACFFKAPHLVERGVWASIFRTLQDALPRTDGSGLVAGTNPVYTVLKIVKPLVRSACLKHGKTCLLADDEIRSGITAAEYKQYEEALARELKHSIDTDTADRSFWVEHGNVMASFSDPLRGNVTRATTPEMDRVGLAMVLGFPSDVQAYTRTPSRVPTAAQMPKGRPTPGIVEGGVEGVRHTRREAHFESMLLSEFLNPRDLLIDRLVNSGYFILERRPRREKLRDVLIVGIMPPALAGKVHASVVKACWLDTMTRLGRLFTNARLHDTEFRWIEGDPLGRGRSCSFALAQLPPDILTDRADGTFRRAFLTHLRWLPDYLDTQSGYRALDVDERGHPEAWAAVAWKANSGRTGPASMRAFSFVHLMIFLPAGASEAFSARGAENTTRLREARERIGRLRGTLGIGYHTRRHLSVTYVPDSGTADWHYGSESDSYLAVRAAHANPGGDLSAALQRAWIAQLTKEIWHG
jgi:hypothetical protein